MKKMSKNLILQRPKVVNMLDKMHEYPLTVITAPAGFGKSTVLRDYLDKTRVKYIWIEMCSVEYECKSILDIIVNQIFIQSPEFGVKLNKLRSSASKLTLYTLLLLVREHLKDEKYIVVIDNYEYVKNNEADELIENISRFRLDSVGLIIVSRTLPQINMEELKFKNLCLHIDQSYFLMSCEDINKYLDNNHVKMSDENIHKALEISEGWITGVKILMQCYKKDGVVEFDSDFDRLIHEMIIKGSSMKSRWMMQIIALFGEISVDLILHLAEFELTKKEVLDIISDSGFILRNHRSSAYRLHRVLDIYYERNQEINAKSTNYNNLYSKAGKWYIQKNEIIKGLRCFYLAGNYNEFLNEFRKSMSLKLLNNNTDFIVETFENIPMYTKLSFPFAYLYYIDFYLTNIDFTRGKTMIEGLENHDISQNLWSDKLKKRFECEMSIVKGYLEFNDVRKMHGYHDKAYCLLSDKSKSTFWHKHCSLGSIHLSYLYFNKISMYREITQYIAMNFKTYELITGNCGAGFKEVFTAEYLYETGQFLRAAMECKKGRFRAEEYSQKDIILCSKFLDARISFAEGRLNEGLGIAESIFENKSGFCCPIMREANDVALGYIAYITGKDYLVAEWLKTMDFEKCHISYEGIGYVYIVGGMILLMNHKYVILEAYIEDMLIKFERYNNIIGYIHCHILDAIAKFNISNFHKADIALSKAIDYARVDGIIQPFAEYSRDLLLIMEKYTAKHEYDDFTNKTLKAMYDYKKNMAKICKDRINLNVLSERELEVIKLIVEGNTNREIAIKLHFAEITVKKHVSSIYKKLNVSNRSKAVRKYLELNTIKL